MVNVYILGGGVSGLNSARELAMRGANVTLIEGSDRWGGLAGYVHHFERNLDLGPHIFHTPDEDISDYLLKSFPGKFFERKHWAKNLKDEKYYSYPLSREFIDSLDIELRNKIQTELDSVDHEAAKKALNYHDYIGAIAGPTLRDMFFTVYPKKLWGLPTKDLDANWAPKRVQIREKNSPFFGEQWSAVGVDGTSSIIDELVKQCIGLGVNLHLNERIVSLETSDKSSIVGIGTTKKLYKLSSQDLVINTLPLDAANELLGETTNVKYRGVMLVYVHTSQIMPFPDGTDFIYVDSPSISFNRVSDQNTFVKCPNKNDTVLCCEITYSMGDELDLKSVVNIENKVVDELVELNIISREEYLGSVSVKLPRVYPMYSIGYREETTASLSKLAKFVNLYSIGSLAEFAYTDLQILFAKSRDLAELVAGKTSALNNNNAFKENFAFDKSFELLGKRVGGEASCFTIAEIGLNHNGSLELAKKLIVTAMNAGFDAVKFQSFKSEGRSSAVGKTSRYVEKVLGTEETDFEMFQKYELTYEQHSELFEFCKTQGIPMFSAPFDAASAHELNLLGIDAFKIASMELTNLDLIKTVANFGKPIILSTGMANISEVESALQCISKTGNQSVAILQCTSIYPAPASTLNLRAMETLNKAFNVPVGFSDHYHSDIMGLVAAGLGAKLIEKHVTLDRQLEGPDHALSLSPPEQVSFIRNLRDVEAALGNGIKQASREEVKSEIRFRKSMHFNRDVQAGDILTEDDIVFKAPCFGLLPKYKEFAVGLKLSRVGERGQPITWDYFS